MRTALTASAISAQPMLKISASVGPCSRDNPKAAATSAVPKLWPNTRVVACMPPAAPARLRGADQQEWLARLRTEEANLRGVLRWLTEAGADGPGDPEDIRGQHRQQHRLAQRHQHGHGSTPTISTASRAMSM